MFGGLNSNNNMSQSGINMSQHRYS